MPLTNGKVKSIFSLHIGDTNYVADLTAFKLYSEPLEQERITFLKYETGTAVRWKLEVSAIFDGGSQGSLHDYLWDNSGSQAAFIIKPFQQFDPLTKRFFQGTVRIGYKPPISVKANEVATYDFIFDVVGQPSRSDAPGGFLTEGYYDTY